MPNVNDLKQSRFLTQGDVDPPVLVTIRAYKQENVALEGADPEYRWTLVFDELDKPMTLNSTNGQIIAAIVGSEEFGDWVGRKIVLYRDPNVSFGGKLVGGIRCRAQKNQPQQTTVDRGGSDELAKEITRGKPEMPTGDDIPF